MNEGDRAIIGLLDIIHAHIDNGDFDKARGVINRTKMTLDGLISIEGDFNTGFARWVEGEEE